MEAQRRRFLLASLPIKSFVDKVRSEAILHIGKGKAEGFDRRPKSEAIRLHDFITARLQDRMTDSARA